MHTAALVIFFVTYAGVAAGGIPGLALDRTGIALLGAIVMILSGALSTEQAVGAIDISTILLLYSLMVVSAQFRLGGFYTRAALGITRLMRRPGRFLLAMMSASAALSAVLANDIVCLAFAPVLAVSLGRAGLNPVPFLVGLAVSSNIGSAATIIGNPQNMLIGQVGRLHFGHFFLWCFPPAALSLAASYLIIRAFLGASPPPGAGGPLPEPEGPWPGFDRHQSAKGIAAAAALIALFFTGIPREISAISVAGLLLLSRRMATRSILGLIDWHLITLFCALFIVIKGLETTGAPEAAVAALGAAGVDIRSPYVLALLSTALSNLVSNVPAAMLLVKFLDPSVHQQWYVLAVTSTFAGNLLTVGSIANLITIEQARVSGVRIGFGDYVRIGLPVTAASLLVTVAWIPLSGLLGL